MSTRSMIGMKKEDGTIKAIYCHHDGYVQGGVGETLFYHYQETEKIEKLLNLGFLSALGNVPVSTTVDKENGCEDYAIAHEEGIEDNEAVDYASEEEYIEEEFSSDREYIYLWIPSKEIAGSGEWYVANWKFKKFDNLRLFVR